MAIEARLSAMECQQYPDVRRGAKAGLLCGLIAFTACLIACHCVALAPAVTPVSLSVVFRPWWRAKNWGAACAVFVTVFLAVGIPVALRPVPRDACHDGKSTGRAKHARRPAESLAVRRSPEL